MLIAIILNDKHSLVCLFFQSNLGIYLKTVFIDNQLADSEDFFLPILSPNLTQ